MRQSSEGTGAGSHHGAWPAALSEEYEVVFTEDRLGLTLRYQATEEAHGPSPTIVKATSETTHRVKEGDMLVSINGQSVVDLDFRDVRRLLKISARPIRLRFRTMPRSVSFHATSEFEDESDLAISDIATASGSSVSSSSSISKSDEVSALAAFLSSAEPTRPQDSTRDDDQESQQAVLSESFGDADSTRDTENSSVITDFTDVEFKFARHSSSFTAFLRKPFRRTDGLHHRVLETRMGAIPSAPRVELSLESPCKAAIRVYWKEFPRSVSSQIQFSRDRTMKVWKNWPGRIRRSRDNDRELTTTIFGLDFGKSYVVRVRFAINPASIMLSEWSAPSSAVLTLEPTRLESLRAAYLRASRS